jgi:hypothetical protein
VLYGHALAELQDLLQRADLLKSWHQSNVYKVDDCLRVDFSARIAIRASAHAKPAGVDFTEAEVELILEIGKEDSLEAIRRCSAQVVIDGINTKGDICRFALHFDRHDPSVTATDLHAHYHWQMGGYRMAAQDFGTILHLEGPRFPWHPLDPVLLVDFVLGHFHGAKRAELMEAAILTRYPRILYASQTVFVVPFFTALYQALNTDPFVATPYWPSLCGRPD